MGIHPCPARSCMGPGIYPTVSGNMSGPKRVRKGYRPRIRNVNETFRTITGSGIYPGFSRTISESGKHPHLGCSRIPNGSEILSELYRVRKASEIRPGSFVSGKHTKYMISDKGPCPKSIRSEVFFIVMVCKMGCKLTYTCFGCTQCGSWC